MAASGSCRRPSGTNDTYDPVDRLKQSVKTGNGASTDTYVHDDNSNVVSHRGPEQHGLADDMLRIEELEAALPAMTRWRVPGGRSVDWAALEAILGTTLPSDFRSLAEAYPVLVIDDLLSVSVPRPGAEASWASEAREDEVLQDLYEMGDTQDYVPFPEPGGLISWASSYSGDTFYWKASPKDPDAWPVVVRTDNADWIEFPVGAVEFLAGVYGRTIDVPGMPGNFPSDDPQVLGLEDRID